MAAPPRRDPALWVQTAPTPTTEPTRFSHRALKSVGERAASMHEPEDAPRSDGPVSVVRRRVPRGTSFLRSPAGVSLVALLTALPIAGVVHASLYAQAEAAYSGQFYVPENIPDSEIYSEDGTPFFGVRRFGLTYNETIDTGDLRDFIIASPGGATGGTIRITGAAMDRPWWGPGGTTMMPVVDAEGQINVSSVGTVGSFIIIPGQSYSEWLLSNDDLGRQTAGRSTGSSALVYDYPKRGGSVRIVAATDMPTRLHILDSHFNRVAGTALGQQFRMALPIVPLSHSNQFPMERYLLFIQPSGDSFSYHVQFGYEERRALDTTTPGLGSVAAACLTFVGVALVLRDFARRSGRGSRR